MDKRDIARDSLNRILTDTFERMNRDQAYDLLDEAIEEAVIRLNQNIPNYDAAMEFLKVKKPHWKYVVPRKKNKGYTKPTRYSGLGLQQYPVYQVSEPIPELDFEIEDVPPSPTERVPSPLSRELLNNDIDNIIDTIVRSAAIQAQQDRMLQKGKDDNILNFQPTGNVNRQLDLGTPFSMSPGELMKGGRKKKRRTKKKNKY